MVGVALVWVGHYPILIVIQPLPFQLLLFNRVFIARPVIIDDISR